MISAAGQQKLSTLVHSRGQQAVRDLVEKKDVGALKQAGLSEIDARALLGEAHEKGLDAVFAMAAAQKGMGGAVSQTAGGQQSVSQAAGRAGMPIAAQGGLSALAAVRGGTALDGIEPAKVQEYNLRGLTLPKEISRIADEAFGDRSARIATAGYSAPPSGTAYAEHTERFLGALADRIGTGDVGFTTSPTADQGSIDAITTMLGQQKGVPVVSITAKDYVGYIDPNKFPPEMDKAAYAGTPKYVFPDTAKYNQATALASNAFIATGGRNVTVFDFMRAIEARHPVVLVVDDSLTKALGDKAIWDGDKGRANNGAAYLEAQLASFDATGRLAHPTIAQDKFGSFDEDWLKKHGAAARDLVKVVHLSGPDDIDQAAHTAARHIAAFTQSGDSVAAQAQLA